MDTLGIKDDVLLSRDVLRKYSDFWIKTSFHQTFKRISDYDRFLVILLDYTEDNTMTNSYKLQLINSRLQSASYDRHFFTSLIKKHTDLSDSDIERDRTLLMRYFNNIMIQLYSIHQV